MQNRLLETSISLQCTQEHKCQPIIYLDLKKDVQLHERTLCSRCAMEGRGRLSLVEEAVTQYLICQDEYRLKMDKIMLEVDEKLIPLKYSLYDIREKINSRIQKILDVLNEVQNIIKKDYSRYKIMPDTQSSLQVLRQIAQELSFENENDAPVSKYYKIIIPQFKEFSKDLHEFVTSTKAALKNLLCDKIYYDVIQKGEQNQICNAQKPSKKIINNMKSQLEKWEKQQTQQQLWNIEYQLTTQRQSQNSTKESEQKQIIVKCSQCKAEIHENPLEQQKNNKDENEKNNSQSENPPLQQRLKIVEQDPEPFQCDQFTKWEMNGQKILFKQKFEQDIKQQNQQDIKLEVIIQKNIPSNFQQQQQCSKEKSRFNGNKEFQNQNKMPYIYKQGNDKNIISQDQSKYQNDIKHNDRDEDQIIDIDDDPKN